MNNEELCTLIQAGHKEYMTALWNQTQYFGYMLAARFHARLGGYGKLDLEDLLQCRWFAFLQAIDYFDADKGTFLTCYKFKLKNVFRKAAGIRSSRREPLDSAYSLDAPATNQDEGEDITLLDTIADSEDPFTQTEDNVYAHQLHDALEKALDSLPDYRAKHIRQHFFQGLTFKEIADLEGVTLSAIRAQEVKSFRALRSSPHAARLHSFLTFDQSYNEYRGTSLKSLRRSDRSQAERYIELKYPKGKL